jgi:hypothetical protein
LSCRQPVLQSNRQGQFGKCGHFDLVLSGEAGWSHTGLSYTDTRDDPVSCRSL